MALAEARAGLEVARVAPAEAQAVLEVARVVQAGISDPALDTGGIIYWVCLASGAMMTSMRRFIARPLSVALDAIGRIEP